MSATARKAIWRTVYAVRAYELDARGHLAVSALANFLQDAAGCHAQALGVSIDQLQPRQLSWVLVRLRLQLDRHLMWQDRLRIHTWPSRQEDLISQRDFLLFDDSGGGEIGRCATSWVLMDSRRWRPQRLTALPSSLPVPEGTPPLAIGPEKVAPPEACPHECRFQVGHRDLDRNGHVNHVRYIEWALETVPLTVLNTCRLEDLAVDFTGEAMHGDGIQAGGQADGESPSAFRHLIRSQSTGNDLARITTRWRPCT